jgi:hypothetical protein
MTTNVNQEGPPSPSSSSRPRSFLVRNSVSNNVDAGSIESAEEKPTKWSMGVLNDPETHEVPGK